MGHVRRVNLPVMGLLADPTIVGRPMGERHGVFARIPRAVVLRVSALVSPEPDFTGIDSTVVVGAGTARRGPGGAICRDLYVFRLARRGGAGALPGRIVRFGGRLAGAAMVLAGV